MNHIPTLLLVFAKLGKHNFCSRLPEARVSEGSTTVPSKEHQGLVSSGEGTLKVERSMVAHTCKPSTQEAGTGGPWVQASKTPSQVQKLKQLPCPPKEETQI